MKHTMVSKLSKARTSLHWIVGLSLVVAAAAPAWAATQTVSNTNDSGSGSLRAAVAAANAGDTIQFASGVTGTITLTSGELLITKNLTIQGPGAAQLAISGNNQSLVFEISGGVTVTLSGLTIENGNFYDSREETFDGGILNNGTLTVTNSTVSGNTFYGIFNNNGTLTLTNSTVSGNTSDGIANNGTLTVTNSTVSGTTGDGIDNYGTLTLTNSTVSGNTSDGIFNNRGTLTVTNSTIASNTGRGLVNNYGTLTLKGTLLASSGPLGNCYSAGSNTWDSQGYNLSDDSSCSGIFTATGDGNNVSNMGLDPKGLQNNGGPTPTIALLPTSPAVDHIPASVCTTSNGYPATDQRGIARPQGAGCDVGAFELVQTVPFSAFSAQLQLVTGKLAGFNLTARFTLGAGSDGLHPLTDTLTLAVGSYTVTLPPGSLHQVQVGPYSDYAYVGTINKVLLDVQLVPLGGSGYGLQVAGTPVMLTGSTKAVPITLTLGNNTGTTTVAATVIGN